MRARTGDLLACLVLTILILGCFARLGAQPRALIVDGERPSIDHAQRDDLRPVGNDVTFSFLPRYLQVSELVERTGRLPLWDRAGFGGRPLVGNPQGGLFYPPVWLAWLVRAPAALGWLTVGHLLWGGVGVYVLTRGLGVGRWPATVAAGCFEAAPYLLAQTTEGHYPHVWAASWYPWAFWAFGRHRRGCPWGTLLLPPILALAFLTGHPQEWYYLVLALGVWALCDAFCLVWTGSWRGAAERLVLWAGLLGLMIGLVAVELIPDLAAQDWTLRTARMTLRQAGKYHIHAINLIQLLGPDALGGPSTYFGNSNYWETVLSIGLVPLVLGTIALWYHPKRNLVRGWAALTVLSALFAAGHRYGVFGVLFTLVPGMDRFRVPARSLFLANLGAAVLSGLGVEALLNSTPLGDCWRRLEWSYRLVAPAVVLGLFAVRAMGGPFERDWVPSRPPSQSIRYGEAWSPLEASPGSRVGRAASRLWQSGPFWLALCGTGVLLMLGRSATAAASRRSTVAAGLLGGLAMVELGCYGHALVRVAPVAWFLGADPISTVLRTAAPAVSGPIRIRARDMLYPDIHAFANGIEKINVNDGFQLQHPADLYQTLYPLLYRLTPPDPAEPMGAAVAQNRRELRQAVLDRLNVAFLVSDHIEPESSWPLVATGVWNGNDFAIHRNPTALPRAYVVPRAWPVGDDDPATVLAAFRQIDPREAVVMPSDPLGNDQPGPRQPFTPAAWRSITPDQLDLEVPTAAPGLLVVADTWMPGWAAVVDGRPAPILRGNHAQRVIPLPQPGPHRITLHYEAPGLAWGLTISTGTLVAWGAGVLVLIARRALNWSHGGLGRRPAMARPACHVAEPVMARSATRNNGHGNAISCGPTCQRTTGPESHPPVDPADGGALIAPRPA
jgi:hypothetical protein